MGSLLYKKKYDIVGSYIPGFKEFDMSTIFCICVLPNVAPRCTSLINTALVPFMAAGRCLSGMVTLQEINMIASFI